MSNKRGKKLISGRERKKALSKIRIISVAAAVLLIAAIAIAAAAYTKKTGKSGSGKSDPAEEAGGGLAFPYEFADGKLKAASLFQYSGLNPDCNNEEGEDKHGKQNINRA